MSRALISLALCLLASSASAETARFAVIVGENQATDPRLKPLRFADDDALRNARLMTSLGAEVRLLTVLDADTQARHPHAAQDTRAPSVAALDAALAELKAPMEAARRRGDSVDLFLFFSGHATPGDHGEGRLFVGPDTLTRADLLARAGRSGADFNHLILDACHAASLVFARGAEDEYVETEDHRGAVARYLDGADLSRYPNTGVLLAASRGQETHEWSRIRAGVFGHEVRSGLAGLADVNGDGAVEYSELAAFIQAANQGLAGRGPTVVVTPPAQNQSRPLTRLNPAKQALLALPRTFVGQAFVEDADGDRVADLHPSGEAPTVLALQRGQTYYLRQGEKEARLTARPGLNGERLAFADARVSARGADADALDQALFSTAFGPAFYQGFVSASGHLPAQTQGALDLNATPDDERALWPWLCAGAAVGLGASSAWFAWQTQGDLDTYEDRLRATGLPDEALAGRAEDRRSLAIGLGLSAAAAALTAGLGFWLEAP